MLLPTSTYNNSYPLGNLFYYYINNDYKLDKNLIKILSKHKIVNIQLLTTVLENTVESLILPKIIKEKSYYTEIN